MTPPEPLELFGRLLLFFGAPAIALLPIALVAWFISWLEALKLMRRGLSRAVQAGRKGLKPVGRSIWTRRLVVLASASLIVSASYGFARLRAALEASNLSSEDPGTTGQVWRTLSDYSQSDTSSRSAAWVAIGCVAGLLLSAALGAERAAGVFEAIFMIAAVPAGLLGGLSLISFGFSLLQHKSAPIIVTGVVAALGLGFAAGVFLFLRGFRSVLRSPA